MATETSLERQQRLAAENDDFLQWRRAREAEREMAQDWGGGLINGRPAATVVDVSEVETYPAGPQSTGRNNPALVARNVDRIRNQTQIQQEGAALDRQARYDAFLADRGIDPDTIGGARRTATGLQAPTQAQQDAAREAKNIYNSERSDLRRAANQLARRGNRAAAAELRGQANYLYPQIGGRSSEAQLDYWLNRLNPTPYMRGLGAPANGFGRPVDFNNAAVAQYGLIG